MGRVLFDGAWRPIAEAVALLATPEDPEVADDPGTDDEGDAETSEEVT